MGVKNKDALLAWLFLAPLLLCLVVFIAWPVYQVVSFSLYRQLIYSPKKSFVGLGNYLKVITDPAFWNSILNSLIWTVGSIFFQLIIGIAIAVLLNKKFPGRDVTRGILLFSYLIPEVVAALVFRYILSESTGIVNYVIREFLHARPPMWFSSRIAMAGVIIVNVWKNFPFMVIVFLAQMQSIDRQLYESARIDGSNGFQEFLYITLPALRPVIIIALLFRTIFTFRNFNLIKLFTGGGPLNYTTTLPLQIYTTTFQEFYLGRGAAMSVLMFLIIFALSFGYFALYSRAESELR
jgi:multiple sugar transport system permease protein